MGLYQTEAIIIRSTKYGEADAILTLFSKDRGKISVIAKGIRKPKSKIRGIAQFLTWGNFMLAEGRNLHHLSQGEINASFGYILEDFELLMWANYIVEIVESSIVEQQPNEELFVLLVTTLYCLKHMNPKTAVAAFVLKLLKTLGVQPQFKECVECGSRTSQGNTVRISSSLGGLVCANCKSKDPFAFQISKGSLAIANQFLNNDIRKLFNLKLSTEQINELEKLCREFLKANVKSNFKSWEVLTSC